MNQSRCLGGPALYFPERAESVKKRRVRQRITAPSTQHPASPSTTPSAQHPSPFPIALLKTTGSKQAGAELSKAQSSALLKVPCLKQVVLGEALANPELL